jgi:hypothetical protein
MSYPLRTRVISLRIRAAAITGCCCILLLAALLAMALAAGPAGYHSLLLVTPSEFGTNGIDPKVIEEFCEDEFLLTYELREVNTAKALNSGARITVIGTNSCYRDLTERQMLSGGYFTKAAWEAGERYAVLNEKAAYDMFGSTGIIGKTFDIGGETWLVVGVMRDGEEDNANVYLPSSVTGGRAETLLALINPADGITETYAVNALKEIGTQEESHRFISLPAAAAAYWERFSVSWRTAACLVLVILIRVIWVKARGGLSDYRERLTRVYFRQLLAEHRRGMLSITVLGLLLAVCAVAVSVLMVQILAICLTWQDLTAAGSLPDDVFLTKTDFLRANHLPGVMLFAALLIMLALFFIFVMARFRTCRDVTRERETEERTYG